MSYQSLKKFITFILLISLTFQTLPISDMDLFAYIAKADVKAVKKHIQLDPEGINKQLGRQKETALMRAVKNLIETVQDSDDKKNGEPAYGVRVGLLNTLKGLGFIAIGTLGSALTVGEFLTINADPKELDKKQQELKTKKANEIQSEQVQQILAILNIPFKNFSLPQLFETLWKVIKPEEVKPQGVIQITEDGQQNSVVTEPTSPASPIISQSSSNVNPSPITEKKIPTEAAVAQAESTPKKGKEGDTGKTVSSPGALETLVTWGAQGAAKGFANVAINFKPDVKDQLDKFVNDNVPAALEQLPEIGKDFAQGIQSINEGAQKFRDKVLSEKNTNNVENIIENVSDSSVNFKKLFPKVDKGFDEAHHIFLLIISIVCIGGALGSFASLGYGFDKSFKGLFKQAAGKPFHAILRANKIRNYKTIINIFLSRENLNLSLQNTDKQTLRDMVHQMMLENLEHEDLYNVLREVDELINDRLLVIGVDA